MDGEWITKTVKELIELNIIEKPLDGNHGNYHPKGSDFVSEGIPFITAADISNDSIDFINCKFITCEQAKTLQKGFSRTNDVLLTHKASIGRTAIVPDIPWEYIMLTPQVTYYRVKDSSKLNNRYLKYYFDSSGFQNLFQNWADAGSTRAYLGITEQQKLPILLPPINVQNAIADILGTIDDKIKSNQQVNETLQGICWTLFKDWFIDFGPVKAKALGQQPPGLDADIAALFPDKLGEDGIPVGWEDKPLDKIANFLNGLALQKYPAEGDDYLPVIKIAELRNGITDKTAKASRAVPAQYVIQDGDTLFSWSGSLVQVIWTSGEGALNQHLFKVFSEEYPKWFHYYWVEHHLSHFQAIAASKATTMGHIQRHHLTEALTIVPSEPVLKVADEIIGTAFERIIKNSLENKTLASIRDALLPKLISGEIPVKDAEAQLEEVS